jgi:hypothetical protein
VTQRLAVVLVAIAGAWSLVGCSSMAPPLPCDVAIVALPADSMLVPGDPLPPGSQVLAAPDDFDRTAITFGRDSMDYPAVNLELRGDAIGRVGAYTAGHMGEFLAISVNGSVVAVPMIQGPLLDGKLQVTGSQDGNDLTNRFAGCVR